MSTSVHRGIQALLASRPGAILPTFSVGSNAPEKMPEVIGPGNTGEASTVQARRHLRANAAWGPLDRADTDRAGALPIAMENIRASGTEIRETDLAVRVAGEARGQVLASVSRSLSALANPQPQNVLDLLM